MSALPDRTENGQPLGKALRFIVDAIAEPDRDKLVAAASLLEDTCDAGVVTVLNKPVIRALAALAYDATGEPLRGERSYTLLGQEPGLPLNELLKSHELSRIFTNSLSLFGLRKLPELKNLVLSFLQFLKTSGSHVRPETDEIALTCSILVTAMAYHDYIFTEEISLSALEERISAYGDLVEEIDTESWLAILARLFKMAIQSAVGRSIIKLDLPSAVKDTLRSRGMIELWPPQAEAVEAGLLKGRNLVYATETATGKSLLAYITSSSSTPKEKTVYIVPTRTLADEAFKTIAEIMPNVAVSTRERNEYDDDINSFPILVSTYEKFDALLRRERLHLSSVKRLIADEAYFISSVQRGIPLEFLITRFRQLSISQASQVVAISGMIDRDEANRFAGWLNAGLVHKAWRPVDLDEMIYFGGSLYHKDGRIEIGPIKPQIALPKWEQRLLVTQLLARDTVTQDGQCMVVVGSRVLAETIAERVSAWFEANASSFLDADLRVKLQEIASRSEPISSAISAGEPELPVCAKKLLRHARFGVAYHHAGLPAKYREIVESGIRDRAIRLVVTTTTFEAGVNLPVTRVIFPFSQRTLRGRLKPLSQRTYNNLAGRAGRPGFDKRGEAILIALTSKEKEDLLERYFTSRVEPLESGIEGFMRRRPVARYAVQSQILAESSQEERVDFSRLLKLVQGSWFWARASDDDREKIQRHLRTEVRKLQVYGFVRSQDLAITSAGRAAAKSMLTPLGTVNLMRNCQKIFSGSFSQEQMDILVLSLVGIPSEVSGNDRRIGRVKVANEAEFVAQVIRQDDVLYEPADRLALCAKYATILWYWIESLPTEQILETCGLDASSDAALLEETLPNDAYWILTSVANLPTETTRASEEQRQHILELASYCKIGSSDPIVGRLLGLGLEHMGRNTAIKLARFLREQRKDLQDLTQQDLIDLFAQNKTCALLLYSELEQASKRRERMSDKVI